MSEDSDQRESGEAQGQEQQEQSDQHSSNTADHHSTDIPWWRQNALQLWLVAGLVIHISGVVLECVLYRFEERAKMPKSVEIAYGYCTVAYACNLLLSIMRWAFARSSRSASLLLISCFISSVSSTSYLRLWTRSAYVAHDVQSVLFLPTRWWLYMSTMPAIWWILSHISAYGVRRRIYVLWLNSVMLVAGGLATIPCISWGHKVYWMAISCLPFPELCYHIWRMLSDAIESSQPLSGRFSLSGLYFVRVFGQFCYQLFPAVYFAAYDGCLPLYVSEPLWSICDWCLKMCMTSSLMEAEFFTVAQKLQYYMHLVEQSRTYETMKQLMLTVERKDRFLSVMSHELRTPLNGIIGMTDAITTQHGNSLSQAVSSTIGVIKLSGKRLMQLINDLLDAAQLRKGQLVLKHEEVNLNPVIDDVMQQVMPFVQAGVTVYKRMYDLPHITGDPGRIEQVLFNLISNAAKFTHSGYIRVGAGYLPHDDMVFLYVRDTGCGIEASIMPKVFRVFEQADMTTTRAHGGAGLGLHFVQELVRAHRGKISLKSMVGAGTLVTVRLPLSQPEKVAQESRTSNMLDLDDIQNLEELMGQGVSYDEVVDAQACQAESVRQLLVQPVESGMTLQCRAADENLTSGIMVSDISDQQQSEAQRTQASVMPVKNPVCLADPLAGIKTAPGKHKPTSRKHLFHRQIYGRQLLLSVDDDPINQMVVSNLLQPMGCRVQQAMNGHEALAVLEQAMALPDLVLLDCMMPGMSGYSVCQYMRSRYGHSLPVMMVSANSETKDVLKGLENGANDYIRKPFQREDLHMRVQAHIHTMQQCDTEVEARMPWSLLHLSVTKQMEVELMNGADDVSISVPCAAVFYIMMQPLQADHVSEAQQPDSGATRDVICSVMPMMQAHCSVNKMLFVQKWSTCLVFMTNPELIAEEECIKEMHVFAENTMAMLIEACKVSRASYPAAAITAGPCTLTCLSAILSTSRLMLFGEPLDAAKALVARCPEGHILLRPQRLYNSDGRGSTSPGHRHFPGSSYKCYVPQDNPNAGLHFEPHEADMHMLPQQYCAAPVYQFWPILDLQSDLQSETHGHQGAKEWKDATVVKATGAQVHDGLDSEHTRMERVLEYMCYARSDFHTLSLQWKRLRPNDASAAQDTAIFSRLSHAVKQVFELSETHEQKNLSGNTGSSGSQTLHSTVSISGESHEDGGRISSEGLPQLQFQSDQNATTALAMDCVQADDDLVRLTRRVGVSHTVNRLGECGLTVHALAKMTEAEFAALTGDLLPKRSRILLLLEARQAVKPAPQVNVNDTTSDNF